MSECGNINHRINVKPIREYLWHPSILKTYRVGRSKSTRSKLRDQLEANHRNEFVAIEPESGDYFLGKTLSEAIQAARSKYSDRISFALRIGHPSAVHLGVMAT